MLLLVFAKTLALMGVSYAFGASLELSELVHRRGWRWFPRAPVAAAIAAGALAVGMLALGHPTLHLLWVAVLGSWLLRGRIRGLDGVVVAGAMVGFLASRWPLIAIDPLVLPYFAVPLVGLGLGADLLARRGGKASRLLARIVEERLHWYALAAGYCFWFELDPALCLGMYGFLQGQAWMRAQARRGALTTWGLRRAASAD